MLLISLLVLFHVLQIVNSECSNACNGHGKCTSYDMCLCHRNWQGNDCSERTCQFGYAHVDTPKGDLDMSGGISGPDHPVIFDSFSYPYGTTERFPQMEDSDLNVLSNTAHYYMECSNKGLCDRKTGECSCYDGYDGAACQRASCPGYPKSCSGHGTCLTINQLAALDYSNVYKLWDRDATMGCSCDKGYFGADCSLRSCKVGVDPLYVDDSSTQKFSTFFLAILTTANNTESTLFDNGEYTAQQGKWAIRFYDYSGEDWITVGISANALCDEVVTALEGLPNNVIPTGSVYCSKFSIHNGTIQSVTGEIYGRNTAFADAKYSPAFEEVSSHSHPRYNLIEFVASEEAIAESWGEVNPLMDVVTYASSYDNVKKRLSGNYYELIFSGNPGYLTEPSIELYLDGKRPSLISKGGKVITKVWTDGAQGENKDYFADHCDGVTVQIAQSFSGSAASSYLTSLTVNERNLLKACLGDSDFDPTNNVDVYNWDYGNELYPHAIKLTADSTRCSTSTPTPRCWTTLASRARSNW